MTASSHPDYKPGDKVVLNGWGVGEVHYGGYAEMARVKGDWLIPLPDGLGTAEAMAIGTAGYTAMLALIALERHGLTPERGPLVVTGASGGLGSFAVALLADRGFKVAAVTGRKEESDYLGRLGAGEIVDRAELTGQPRALGKERWAGGVDAVGGVVLANLISMTAIGGAIAACGNAGGMELSTSVAPFILRGVSLLGIDSVRASKAVRSEAWRRLAHDLDRGKLAAMTTTIPFDAVQERRPRHRRRQGARTAGGRDRLKRPAGSDPTGARRSEADHADHDQVDRHDHVEEPRHEENQDAGDQSDGGLDGQMNVHEGVSGV